MVSAAPCRICESRQSHRTFLAREMMFGTREAFEYFECSTCGCVQIAEIPDDVGRHYPTQYYSFRPPVVPYAVRALKRWRARTAMRATRSPTGRLITMAVGTPAFLDWLSTAGLPATARILEVGAGRGVRLLPMADAGLPHLLGIDPFLDEDVVLDDGRTRILKLSLEEVEGEFDLIMFHHTFEHVPDQAGTLRAAAQRLSDTGVVLLRLPVAGSFAWRTYGSNWVQLDPPRHLYLHTPKSLGVLAAAAGLSVDKIVYDSTAFQIWGSEMYRAGQPLSERKVGRLGEISSAFRPASVRERRIARRLNSLGDGDQAAFYLRPMR